MNIEAMKWLYWKDLKPAKLLESKQESQSGTVESKILINSYKNKRWGKKEKELLMIQW